MSNIGTKSFEIGSSSTKNEPNFKIVCNCIHEFEHELLNVFEDSAQREHTIVTDISEIRTTVCLDKGRSTVLL